MYKIFVDTNVVLEHALKRNQYIECTQIFELAETQRIECFASAQTFYTLSFYLRKVASRSQAHKILRGYLSFIDIVPTGKSQLILGLGSAFNDLEDSFQYYTALGHVDFAVTINIRDYRKHELPDLRCTTPAEFLKIFHEYL